MAGITPVANYSQSNYTINTGTVYKTKIDANFIAAQRVVDNFAAHQLATAAMKVVLEPGHIFSGTTLTEVGAQITLTTTNGSTSATVASATGISNGMVVDATGVPNNTTATISGTTVTLSAAATASGTVAATFLQVTGAIAAPSGNPRIDRVVIDRFTGVLSVLTGTPATTPAPPAITSGKVPVCQILLQTSSTSITNSMLTDERDFAALGHGTAGEYNVGTGPNNVVQLNASSQLPAVDGSLLTGIVSVPTGMVAPFAGSAAPAGWLLCFGQAVNRITYAALFTVLGTTYGAGNGSTTFNLPDLRGRSVSGKDDMGGTAAGVLTTTAGLTGSTLGSSGGEQTHTLTVTEMPSHGHVAAGGSGANTNDGTIQALTGPASVNSFYDKASAIQPAGGDGAHNNMQPTLVLNYIIKI